MAKTKILVVEDENIVAMNLKNKLKGFGYDVVATVPSGERAIQKAEEMHPDLVLMDIMLKGEMDGVQAAEQIRDRFNIPVIYLTAYSDDSTLWRAKTTGSYGYLLKPFKERELHTNIEIALYKHKLDEELRKHRDKLEEMVKERTADLVKANEQLQREIEEHKRAKEALQRSEENLRRIFHSVPESLLAVSDQMEVLSYNAAFAELVRKYAPKLNMSEDELRQRILSELRKHFGKTKHGIIEIGKKPPQTDKRK